MTKQCILQDTNLSEVAFSSDGQALTLVFLSMRDGREEARLNCRGLIAVKYHIVPSSAFPLYVGELIHEELQVEDSVMRLRKLQYGFSNHDGTIIPKRLEQLHFIHLEGGEIDIVIVCSEVACNRP